MSRPARRASLFVRLAVRTAAASFGFLLFAGAALAAVSSRTVSAQVEARMSAVADSLDRLPPEVATDPVRLCRILTEDAPVRGTRPEVYVELVTADGAGCRPAGTPTLADARRPPTVLRWLVGTDLPQVAPDGDRAPVLVLTRELPTGGTVRIGGDLTDATTLARRLWLTLLVLAVPGALVAAVLGSVLTRNGLRPVGRLAEAADRIARTQDLSVPVEVPEGPAHDEVSRLAHAFRAMTVALEGARERQAQLVADAGHELRTPLTSLRTNVELLVRSERSGRPLPAQQRDALLADVTGQLDELSHLVSELVVLAHEEAAVREDVRFDVVVERAVERARRRTDGHRIEAVTVPWVVPDGDVVALERAVVNLLDNAVKFSPPGSTIRVRTTVTGPGIRLTVDDEGPGVAAEHRSDVFERFWRAREARSLPGSGLGLSIVAAAAASHGGAASLEEAPGGGARAVLDLPGGPPG